MIELDVRERQVSLFSVICVPPIRVQQRPNSCSKGPWTVFAPDNEAWQALPKEIFDHIVSDPVLLRQILTYHVVQANATRMQLINDEKLPSLYENRPIHINFYTDGWASVSSLLNRFSVPM